MIDFDAERKRVTRDESIQRITAPMSTQPMRLKDIARMCRYSSAHVLSHMKIMEIEGLVTKPARGCYALTEAGLMVKAKEITPAAARIFVQVPVNRAVLMQFKTWLLREGYNRGHMASPSAFFSHVFARGWRRKKVPSPLPQPMAVVRNHFSIPHEIYLKLDQVIGTDAFPDWDALLRDIVANNWERRETSEPITQEVAA